MPDSKKYELSRITLCGMTCMNASHVASAVDVVLGSFRYCINNPKNIEAASQMMTTVIEMMWHDVVDNKYEVHNRGLISRPLYDNIGSTVYKARYDELITHINMLLKEANSRKGGA
jgi:hypothetical protein